MRPIEDLLQESLTCDALNGDAMEKNILIDQIRAAIFEMKVLRDTFDHALFNLELKEAERDALVKYLVDSNIIPLCRDCPESCQKIQLSTKCWLGYARQQARKRWERK